MSKSLLVAASLGFALLGVASAARAREDAKAHLVWQVSLDGACVDQATIARQVEQRLGRRVFVAREQADIVLEVAVKDLDNQSRSIAVTLRSQKGAHWGERDIQVEADCHALESSLALMLSLTADIAKEEVERRIQRDRLGTTSVAPVLSISAVEGLLPSLAVGPQLALGVYSPLLGWWELHAAWYPNQSVGDPTRAEFRTGLLGLHGCPLALHGVRTSVWACVAAHGAYLAAKGRGFDASYEQLESIFGAGAAIRGSWEMSDPWFLAASVGGDITLRRPRFYYETGAIRQDLFSVDPALFFVKLGVGLRL